MLITYTIGPIYYIGHAWQAGPPLYYSFPQNFLSSHTLNKLGWGQTKVNGETNMYVLDEKGDRQTRELMDRLHSVKSSGYAYASSLEKVYLMELLHRIFKLKLEGSTAVSHLPGFSP